MTFRHPITGHQMTTRDAVTGAEVIVARDGNRILFADDGVDILHLTPASALLLARQLIESVTPGDAINLIGGDR